MCKRLGAQILLAATILFLSCGSGNWTPGRVIAFDAKSGAEIWAVEAHSAVLGAGEATEAQLFVAGSKDCNGTNGTLQSYEAASGARQWERSIQDFDCIRPTNTPRVEGGIVQFPCASYYDGRSSLIPGWRPSAHPCSFTLSGQAAEVDTDASLPKGFLDPFGQFENPPQIVIRDVVTEAVFWSKSFEDSIAWNAAADALTVTAVVLKRGDQAQPFRLDYFGFDLVTGDELWRRSEGIPADPTSSIGPPLPQLSVAGSTVFAWVWEGPSGRSLRAIDAASGLERYRFGAELGPEFVNAQDGLALVFLNGALAAVNQEDGEVLWRTDAFPISRIGMLFTEDKIYSVAGTREGGTVVAIDRLSGSVRWKEVFEHGMPSISVGDELVAVLSPRRVVLFDEVSGSRLWAAEFPVTDGLNGFSQAHAAIADGKVFVTISGEPLPCRGVSC